MSGQHRQECDHLDLAVGWALHALEPDEEAEFAEHLPQCAECAQRVDRTESVAALLAAGVEQVDPPPRLREAVLAAARAPQNSRPTGVRSAPVAAQPPAAVRPDGDQSDADRPHADRPHADRLHADRRTSPPLPVGAPVTLGRLARSRRVLAVAVAAVLVAVGIGWVAGAVLGPDGASSNALPQLSAQSVRSATLVADGGDRVFAVVLTEGSQASLVPVSMKPAAAGEAFWLWGIADGAPVPLGRVSPGSGAVSSVVDAGSADPSSFPTFAVSSEPVDAVPTAPSTIVAKSDA